MAIYIPMSRMGRVSVADFQQVASCGDPEVFAAGCPNRAAGLKLGSEVQISGVSNVVTTSVTCRDTIDGKIILCGGCHAHFQQAKEARDEGLSSEDFIYFTEDDSLIEGTKTYKERVSDWVKTHPLATAIGVVGALGAVVALSSYLSSSSSRSAAIQQADTDPTPTPALAKQTTKGSIPQKVSKELTLNLDIFNSQDKQALNIETKQAFKNGTWVKKQHVVPTLSQAQLTFDINKKHHKYVQVNYTNHFDLDLRSAQNSSNLVPTNYIFGKSFVKTNSKGEYMSDRNTDGILAASHTFFTDVGYYFLSREIEDLDGEAIPSVTTRDVNLFIQSRKADYHHYDCQLIEIRGGRLFPTEYRTRPLMQIEHKIKTGTDELGVLFMNFWDTAHEHKEAIYTAKDLPIDSNNDVCVYADATDLFDEVQIKPGRCDEK